MALVLRQDDLWEVQSFGLRRLLDLQFESIWRCLEPELARLPPSGTALDVGAGRSPFRTRFPPGWTYVTLDPHGPADYAELAALPGDLRADLVLLTEVLEHVPDPGALLRALREHTTDAARVWITVPFNARVHGAPNDYRRWTPAGLELLLADGGWVAERVVPRGSDLTTLAAKAVFLCARRLAQPMTALPAALGLLLLAAPLLALAHVALRLGLGIADDPVGYFVVARRSASSATS